jgi:hypothetical protein
MRIGSICFVLHVIAKKGQTVQARIRSKRSNRPHRARWLSGVSTDPSHALRSKAGSATAFAFRRMTTLSYSGLMNNVDGLLIV